MTDTNASRIIVAGHICLDIIPQLPGAAITTPGRLMKIGPATVSTGGAVANTGLALHQLGVPVRLMGKVGNDTFGANILDTLRAYDLALADGMIVATGETTSYSIVISPPGIDRTFWHCTGANDTFSAGDIPYDQLGSAKHFHFGYPPIMARMYTDGGAELSCMLQQVRERGLATSLDMAQPDPQSEAGRLDWASLLKRVLPDVDVFFPSIDELLYMLDRPTHAKLAAGDPNVIDGTLLRRLGQQLIDLGVAVAVIKLGESGLYARTSANGDRVTAFRKRLGLNAVGWVDCEVYSPCFRATEVVGTTGSGDCTIGGFLAAMLRGDDVTRTATAATAVGACSVEGPDATGSVPNWLVVQRRIDAGWPRLGTTLNWGDAITATPDATGTYSLQRSSL